MKRTATVFITAAVITSFVGCSKDPSYNHQGSQQSTPSVSKETESAESIVFKAKGNIDSTVNAFRNLLGRLNSAPGAIGGRREINWDGVPANLTNNDLFPVDLYGDLCCYRACYYGPSQLQRI